MVPDFTCHKSNPIPQKESNEYNVLSPSYSGLSIMGGSHSPSISSSQSSGLVASGSAMCSGCSQSSGLESSGSSILARSSQSSGFLASGSLIIFGGKMSQSSSRDPFCALSLSMRTSYV